MKSIVKSMADQAAAADLTADAAAQGELMSALRTSKAALDAFRAEAESSEDTSLKDGGMRLGFFLFSFLILKDFEG